MSMKEDIASSQQKVLCLQEGMVSSGYLSLILSYLNYY